MELIKLNLIDLNDGQVPGVLINPRELTTEGFDLAVKSIQDFPKMLEVRTLVLIQHNNRYVTIGGNQRLRALRELGYKEAPAQIVNWSADECNEFIIKDNLSYGRTDWDIIANDWEPLHEQLAEWGMELPVDFDVTEEVIDGLTDEDEVPELPEEPKTKLGDIYKLGNHRLMCGDSTSVDALDKLMDGMVANLVFTDPPYGIEYQSNIRKQKFDPIKNDDTILDIVPIIHLYSKGWVFVWTTWKVVDIWMQNLRGLGDITNMIIWHKGGGGMGDLTGSFSTDYEIALVFNRGAKIVGKRLGSVWQIGKDASISYVHPTQKPVSLASEAIINTTKSNGAVLDLFGGSGSTLIACEKNNRHAYVMELDPKYCDVIVKRWEEFTGRKAILKGDL